MRVDNGKIDHYKSFILLVDIRNSDAMAAVGATTDWMLSSPELKRGKVSELVS